MSRIAFPIRYFERNLIFGNQDSHNGSILDQLLEKNNQSNVWALYEIPQEHYEYRTTDEKMALHDLLEAFYWNINADTHALMVPRFQSINDHLKYQKERLDPDLRESGERYLDAVERHLGHRQLSRYHFYLAVRLKGVDLSGPLLQRLKYALKDFKRYLEDRSGVGAPEIFEEEIKAYQLQEELIYSRVHEYLGARRVRAEEIEWLIRRGFYRGIGEAPIRMGWKPETESVEVSGKQAKRPRHQDILTLSEGLIDDSSGRHLVIEQVVDGKPVKGYVAFITLSYFPDRAVFPGTEWIFELERLSFPVEASIRTQSLYYQAALQKVRGKKKELMAEEEHAHESGFSSPVMIQEGYEEATELERDLSDKKFPLLRTSVVLCVSASSEAELWNRVQAVRDYYNDLGFQTEVPYGDQWRAFNEMIPGAGRYVRDYIHYMEPATVAASMIGASRQLGDGGGYYLGDSGNLAVFFQHDRGPNDPLISTTGSAAIIGKTGKGKSLLVKKIIYLGLLRGAVGLVFDPKDEWSRVLEYLPELKPLTRVVTLRAIEKDRGKLDPLAGGVDDLAQAAETAKRILRFLSRTNDGTIEAVEIGKAVDETVEEAKETGNKPSMMRALHRLKENIKNAPEHRKGRLEEIYEVLSYQANSGQTRLLFGNGDEEPIDLSKRLTILQVEGLQLPDETQTDYGRIGIAIMMAISDFSRRFSNRPSKRFKMVLFDEAWRMAKAPEGRIILEELVRTGRSKNAAIYIVSQNVKDLMGEEIRTNLGYRFVFGLPSADEAERACQFLNLELSKENIEKIKNLPVGICLMMDLEGRVNELSVVLEEERLYQAFDTTPEQQKGQKEAV